TITLFILLILLPTPSSTLFPYTTLFRSQIYSDFIMNYLTNSIWLWGFSLLFVLAMMPNTAPAQTTDKKVEPKQPGAKLSGTVIEDRKSTRLNSSHVSISYAVFCLKKKIN